MWKIRRPMRSKLVKGLAIFNGIVAALLGWVYYAAKGKMYVLGMVVMVMGLMLIFLGLFAKASKSLNHQREKMAKLQNRRDKNDEI